LPAAGIDQHIPKFGRNVEIPSTHAVLRPAEPHESCLTVTVATTGP
jgi:hypothetical protein